jgi:DNA segregation ATPase FtsK/SpoIIIE, S-DNA-T family
VVRVRAALDDRHKSQHVKKIAKKYKGDEGDEPPIKLAVRERAAEREAKAEKKQAVRQPSRLPEESLLFSELSPGPRASDGYQAPPLTYLDAPSAKNQVDREELEGKKRELSQGLTDFHINGKIVEYTPGPVITTYEFEPESGVKVTAVSGLTEELAMVIKAPYVRIERILGKKAIGIEIPNKKREIIRLRELIESPLFQRSSSPLSIALGKTTSGEIFISDLRDMPHLIVAGATGSGKSVAIHTIITSIIYKSSPKQVRFILIDPKQIELAIYNTLPHLLTPVVTNPKTAKNALDWAVFEMESRYKKLATLQVRDIQQYNKKLELLLQTEDDSFDNLQDKEKLPYIVIIIDELADLMMTSGREVEDAIARIAQKARAVGIHLILATQRPSVDVITGTIKNNFPSRIALAVPSKHDSRTIIDQMGAEKLLGNGDMLFLPPKTATLIRLHCSYVSEEEAVRIVNFLAKHEKPEFNTQVIKPLAQKEGDGDGEGELDELFFQAAETVITTGQASASYLQRRLSVGYARAGRIMDQLQEQGVVSPANSKNQREILISLNDLNTLKSEYEKGDSA